MEFKNYKVNIHFQGTVVTQTFITLVIIVRELSFVCYLEVQQYFYNFYAIQFVATGSNKKFY